MTVLKTSLRSFFSHKGRMVLSGMAVVLSVAFVCGTLVFTATMNTTFDKLFASSASNVMVSPYDEEGGGQFDAGPATGVPDTVPASLEAELAQLDGVERATGVVTSTFVTVVDSDNENIGPTTGAPTIVGNWSSVDERTSEIAEGRAPQGPNEVMVDATTADKHDLSVGDPLRLLTVSGDHDVRIVGISEFKVTNPGAAIVHTDLETAQRYALNGQDAFTSFYVDSDGSVSDEELKQQAAALFDRQLRDDVNELLPAVGDPQVRQEIATTLESASGEKLRDQLNELLPEVSDVQVRDELATAVETHTYKLQTADEYVAENRDQVGAVLDVLEYVLLGFAGVALLVGIFLIVNTFSMLVAQRTREIGLMRAIGSTRRQVNRSVLFEALLLGVFGSVVGFGLGVLLAVGLMEAISATGVTLSTEDLTVSPSVPITGIALGVIVTVTAAYFPARRASRISPMAALRDAGMPSDVRAGRVRAGVGAGLTLAGLASLAATAAADEAVAGVLPLAAGVLLSLVGLILAGPALVGLVVRGLSAVVLRGFGPIGRMAERNALRNPRRTGATASALMIGLALVAGLSVVGTSMVASATDEIDNSLGADYVISTSNFQGIPQPASDAVERVVADGDLDHVTAMRNTRAEIITPNGERFDRNIGATDPGYLQDFAADVVEGDLAEVLGDNSGGTVSIDADTAEQRNLGIGDEITVTFDRGETATLTVRAITGSDSTMGGSSWYVSTSTLRNFLPEEAFPLPEMLFASAPTEGDDEQARAALERALDPYPQMEVRDQAEFKALIQEQVGMLLNMVYGLLGLAIIVAVLGVVNTLALSVIERTREIGLLRAIGLSRRQLRRMIRLESVVIALFGALLGLGLGLAWGIAGQQLMALENMPVLEIPWPTLITVFIGSAVVGLLAALVPAFRAGRMNVLDAIATE